MASPEYHAGSARAVRRNGIVAAVGGVVHVHGTDGDCGWSIAGRGDAGVTDLTGFLVQTVVAGRSHDDHAGSDRILHGANQGIGLRRLVNGMTERQIDDVDLEPLAILDGELERAQDRARVTAPLPSSTFRLMIRAFGATSSIERELAAV